MLAVRRGGRTSTHVFLAFALAGLASPWRAAAQPRSVTTAYSSYEKRAIEDAADALGARLEPRPEGKTIERIDFFRLDPIDVHDPAPRHLNAVHVTSRESVLRHELLVREGNVWRAVLVDESARNLRLLPQLSLVLCVAMQGSSPDRVRLVVITKDVWSLYPDFDVEAGRGGLELLDLEPKETNFAGLHQTVLGRFVLQPATFSLGGGYLVPRFDGQWLSLSVDANVIFNRGSGRVEGSRGTAIVGRPLYSSLTRWAWVVDLEWDDEIYRRYVDATVATFTPAPPATTPLPWTYRMRTLTEEAQVVRSFGWQTKNDLSLGAFLDRATYRSNAGATVDPAALAQFVRTAVPRSRTRVGPFAQWHGYTSDFLRILDFDTMGLQEDYRLGHEAWLRVYPIVHALGSTQDRLGVYAAASYGVRLGDGIARFLLESTIEAAATGDIPDASLDAEVGIATPRMGIGRFVYDLKILDRWRNDLNALSFLGNDTRLRGYPSQYLVGKDLVTSNLEYRSRPVQIASIQWGVAAFYDAGDAFDGFRNLRPKHSVGLGLRILLPQVTRSVFRLDFGFPLAAHRPAGVPAAAFFLTFGQALSLPGPTVPGASLPQ